jgi:hypothetical protein
MLFWWVGRVALFFCFCFFLVFGVYLLIASYTLKDPFHFIMTFFASSLIILISAAILAGVVIRTIKALWDKGDEKERDEEGA